MAWGSIVLTSFSLSFYIRQKIEKDEKDELSNIVYQQGLNLENALNTKLSTVQGVADFFAKRGSLSPESTRPLLQSMVDGGAFTRMSYVDTDMIGHNNEDVHLDMSMHDYIYTVLGGQKVISGPLESRVDGSVRLVLAAPIIKDGQVIGAGTGSYAGEGVEKTLFRPYYGGLGGGFLVSAQTGTLIPHNEGAKNPLGRTMWAK